MSMHVESIAVIFDDRDPKNRGWYARAFDAPTAEQSHREIEIVADMPRRRDAYRAAIAAARRALRKDYHCSIAPSCSIRVYTSIAHDLPAFTLN